jgi:hypothetical protein
LIDFDREWAKMLSAPLKSSTDPNVQGIDPAEVQKYSVQHARYTAGTATRYKPSRLTGGSAHQNLAAGLVVGMRFHSAPVIRLADAKPVHPGHTIKADGRWRLFAFSGDEHPADASSKIRALCRFLSEAPRSPVRKYTPKGTDIDPVIDVRAIFQQYHRDLSLRDMPAFLLPRKGRYGLCDYEKMLCPALKGGHDIFETARDGRRCRASGEDIVTFEPGQGCRAERA